MTNILAFRAPGLPIPVVRDRCDQVEDFLADLSDLSRRYGIAITGGHLFLMNREDHGLCYAASDEAALTF